MQAVILCGGLGTRLGELTKEMPKPLLPLRDGRPVLEHQIEYLKIQGIKDIILAIGHKGEKIRNHFNNGAHFGVNITYSYDEQLGTGGALKQCNLRKDEPFIVINGDTLFNVDIGSLTKTFELNKRIITLTVSETENAYRYGYISEDGFCEKQTADKGNVSIGLYMADPKLLDYISDGYCSLERDVFPNLDLGYFQYNGEWLDMGTIESYEQVR